MKLTILLITALTLFTFMACTVEQETGTVVAIVNDNILTLEQLEMAYTPEIWNEKSLETQRDIINQWVDLTLLFDHARNNELFNNDIALHFLAANASKKIFANALIAHELKNLNFTNDELYNYYRLREAEFTENVREFRVQRIFFNEEEDMRNVKTMLDNRQIAFTPAAQRYSEERIGRNGGYMENMVTKTGPDSLLWEQLDKMDRYHEITMYYDEGWIIARWFEFRNSTAHISFNNVREHIENQLREEKKYDLYEQVLWDARINSKVVLLH